MILSIFLSIFFRYGVLQYHFFDDFVGAQ